jgi:hypothetical protein
MMGPVKLPACNFEPTLRAKKPEKRLTSRHGLTWRGSDWLHRLTTVKAGKGLRLLKTEHIGRSRSVNLAPATPPILTVAFCRFVIALVALSSCWNFFAGCSRYGCRPAPRRRLGFPYAPSVRVGDFSGRSP